MVSAKLVNSLAFLMVSAAAGVAFADALPAQVAPGNEVPKTPTRFRTIAPGVMTTVPPNSAVEDTVSRHDIVELLAEDPGYGEREQSAGNSPAKETTFRHNIWGLEFSYKPLRMIQVDLPDADGNLVPKNIWYLVYRVKNTGHEMKPVIKEPGEFDGVAEIEPVAAESATTAKAVHFAPQFFLESPEFNKVYPDRIIPLAVEAIRKREDPNRQFFDSVEIAGEIPVGKSIWGVATWEDIDPRIDRIHLYVAGLTNAYRWVDPKDAKGEYEYQPGKPLGAHRQLAKKMLQLNFWRRGDEFLEHEGEIGLGLPGELDYTWAYR